MPTARASSSSLLLVHSRPTWDEKLDQDRRGSAPLRGVSRHRNSTVTHATGGMAVIPEAPGFELGGSPISDAHPVVTAHDR
ncbi:hypothetical protein BN11_1600009 [Nostocoides australiense Ben110]|uniref:Uncharacterized protein n=1 Tax=Nostocoides australiense Ben110 TaxID=1193182 RepID=W6K226_9MICO|nr:hypothetical protein BN11_1600009 [Tetrasphaera australiensis Ben110]